MRLHTVTLFAFVLVATLTTLSASELTSPELDTLRAEIAPYVLPPGLVEKVLPEINLRDAPIDELVKVFESHGVEIFVSDSLKEARLNISLRKLNLERILDMCATQIGANWLYQDGRVVLFQNTNELNATYQAHYNQKFAITQKIRAEQRRLRNIYSTTQKEMLDSAYLSEFEVRELTLKEVIGQLSEATVEAGLGKEGLGINIVPLFDTRAYTEKKSYNFRNRSFKQILDSICAEHELQWEVGFDAITIRKAR